ncbi:hypothetical protein ACMHYB_09730 [Sorangium sp. So ce1128]
MTSTPARSTSPRSRASTPAARVLQYLDAGALDELALPWILGRG